MSKTTIASRTTSSHEKNFMGGRPARETSLIWSAKHPVVLEQNNNTRKKKMA
jgi:hypothetical protein